MLFRSFFVNYGFVSRELHTLMHPRGGCPPWTKQRWAQAEAVLAFVRARGAAHPREVDLEFAHGKVKNWFGGSSNASTQLLDGMHYRSLLRIARREGGVRVYAARAETVPPASPDVALDALIDTLVAQYAPLPARTLSELTHRLRAAVPHWASTRHAALARARARLASAEVDGQRSEEHTSELQSH